MIFWYMDLKPLGTIRPRPSLLGRSAISVPAVFNQTSAEVHEDMISDTLYVNADTESYGTALSATAN